MTLFMFVLVFRFKVWREFGFQLTDSDNYSKDVYRCGAEAS